MNEIINYTRLTTSDKLPDKFVTCQSYIPSDKDQAKLGQIFTHLEIQNPWFPTNQVGQTIINTLIKEYYRGTNSSDLVNFEEAVKKVNESLAQIAQSGDTEWIGKLSGVLVLINNSEIHIAQTGQSHSYLYRTNRVNHITEGLENEEAPHPLKTFSNLTSGNLQDGDRLIIANNSFFEVISPNELKLIITSMPPSSAAIESARILQNHGCQEANAIFIEVTNLDQLANLSPEEKIEAVYLDQQILSFRGLSKNTLSNVGSKIGSLFKKSSEQVSTFSKERIAPITKKVVNIKKPAEHKENNYDESELESEASEEVIENHQISGKNMIFENIKTFFFKIKNKLRRSLIHIGLYSRKRSKMYLALLIGVVVVLALTIGLSINSKNKSAKNKKAQEIYNQLISLSGQADVLFGSDQAQAATKYGEVVSLSDQLGKTKFEKESDEIVRKAQAKIDQITKLTKISPESNIEIKNTSSIAFDEASVFLTADKDLYESSKDNLSLKKIAALGIEMKSLEFLPELKLLSGLNNEKLVSFEINGNGLTNSNVEISSPQKLKSYGENLYVSDTKSNQIYKVSWEDNNFSKKSEYLKEQTKIADIRDFAIDGSLYTLSNKGFVSRYSRGNKISEFQISLPGSQEVEYLNLFASEDSEEMLAFVKTKTDHRIIKIKKDGELIKQYSLNDLGNEIKSINIDIKNARAYLANSSKIFKYKLD